MGDVDVEVTVLVMGGLNLMTKEVGGGGGEFDEHVDVYSKT